MICKTCIRLGLWLALLDVCLAGGTYVSPRAFGWLIALIVFRLMIRTRQDFRFLAAQRMTERS